MLKNKLILLGITGGIAAYKSAELARLLIKEGAVVQVVMTENAEAFITPLTMKTLTGRPVYSALYNPDARGIFLPRFI
jgi:phosphopantothenoylcysteine decarboxylase/phosphopantothenate--cysteine ligase